MGLGSILSIVNNEKLEYVIISPELLDTFVGYPEKPITVRGNRILDAKYVAQLMKYKQVVDLQEYGGSNFTRSTKLNMEDFLYIESLSFSSSRSGRRNPVTKTRGNVEWMTNKIRAFEKIKKKKYVLGLDCTPVSSHEISLTTAHDLFVTG